MGQSVTDVGYQKENRKELKKHAATIHCSNTLSLLQRKITNALLYHAYQELMLKDEHEITVKQLCRLIGYQGHNHAAIKEALKGLISTVIELNLINDETGAENWTASSILASVSLEGPLCYYAYSPRMKQLLHSPSMFGKIDLVIQSRFRSSYGLALYENCIRYRGLPHTKWFDIALFKKLMGVPDCKYDIFRDFKRRVLDKSVDEVNTYSDLTIVPELIREGRKVVKIRFHLKERAKKERLGHQKATITSDETSIKERLLTHYGLSSDQAADLLKCFDYPFIKSKMTLVESSKSYQEGKIQHLSAYFISAVKNDYKAHAKQHPIDMEDARLNIELAELIREVKALRLAYQSHREKIIHAAINALSHDEKKVLMEQFYQHAAVSIDTILQLQHSKYSRENILESPQIQGLLRQFALRELDIFTISSLEEFVFQQGGEPLAAWQKLKSYDPDHPLLRFNE